MGVNLVNNEASNNITITHRIPNPFWELLNFQESLTLDYAYRISTLKGTGNIDEIFDFNDNSETSIGMGRSNLATIKNL